MRPIITIVGPTATGKTAVAVEVAKLVQGEILSADSMAVYRGMDIGTAKRTPSEQAQAPFHLVDVAEPDEPYNVSRFKEQAVEALAGIEARGHWPLLVGGTGLYVRVVLEDFGLTATARDDAVRCRLEDEARANGVPALHARLRAVDPESAQKIHPNDRVRIVRALEVFEVSGQAISAQQRADAAQRTRRPAAKFGLTAPRDELYRRIDERVDRMIASGLLEEVSCLLSKGYGASLQPLQSLGYKELAAFLEDRSGVSSLEAAIEEIKQNTRRFAKRQLTWFRADKEISWIDIHGKSAVDIAEQIVRDVGIRLPIQT